MSLVFHARRDSVADPIHDFIQRIGGRENAELALEMLEQLEGRRGEYGEPD